MPRLRVTAKQLGGRHFQINLSSRVALIIQPLLRAGKGGRMSRVKAAYFGFATHDEAIHFANEIRTRFPNTRMQIRKAERLVSAFEIKVSHEAVEILAWEIVKQQPTVSQRIEQHLIAVTSRSSIQPNTPTLRRQNGNRTLVTTGGRMVGID